MKQMRQKIMDETFGIIVFISSTQGLLIFNLKNFDKKHCLVETKKCKTFDKGN